MGKNDEVFLGIFIHFLLVSYINYVYFNCRRGIILKADVMDKRNIIILGIILIVTVFILARIGIFTPKISSQNQSQNASAQTTPIDWSKVDQAMGKTNTEQPGNVYKYSFPRSDLQVAVGDVTLKAGFALGSHVEFKQSGNNEAMFMGDLVLTEEEINPVISQLEQGGVEIMALHNHLIGETPKVMYLHIGGMGDPVKLAQTIHAAVALTQTPLTASTASPTQTVDLNTKQLDQIIGKTGKVNNGIYQYSIPRAEKIMDQNMEIPPAMGVATALNFQPTGNGQSAITGDFVLTGNEVNPVMKALRDNSIEVTALHSHSLTESPRLFYLHFYANDDAVKLAKGLRAGLDKMHIAK